MSRALLVTLPGGGPGRGSSCEDCPFRAWEHLVERGDFAATSRMRELCTNPAFEADGLEGQARSLDAGRLAECIAAETAAADLGDTLDALGALVLRGIQDLDGAVWTPEEIARHPEVKEGTTWGSEGDVLPLLRRALELLRRAGR